MGDEAPTVVDERRMTDAEGLMWRLEVDPAFSSNVATVTLLDRPPDVRRLRARMARAVALVPRLRQRVLERPYGLPPIWVDTEVDLDRHIRHMALPAPGSLRQLLDLAAVLLLDPFDRSRPLWELLVIDGVEGDQAAFIQKMHHTVTDGKNGIKISLQFLDLERDAPDPPPLTDEELDAAEPEPVPGQADFLREALGNSLRFGLDATRKTSELLLDPTRLAEATTSIGRTVRGTVSTLADTERAHSTLWTERSARRHLEALQVPLDPVKDAANELGGTLNVAFLTAAASAAGAYHRELGAPVDSLRASMVISTRTKESGSNAFTVARLRVPTGEQSVAERFDEIQSQADQLRASVGSANLDSLAALGALLPLNLVLRLARQQSGTIDFATSNLRAAPFPLYFAGARILSTYPVGPLAGVAFNLTLMSYCGSLDMGLHLDPAAVTEPALLRELLIDAFDELVASAPGKAKRKPKGRTKAKASS
jgi:WS/DGAT/MGAT family acyltransferase